MFNTLARCLIAPAEPLGGSYHCVRNILNDAAARNFPVAGGFYAHKHWGDDIVAYDQIAGSDQLEAEFIFA
jgi:hypothetical protein